jgi:hypothetical protein
MQDVVTLSLGNANSKFASLASKIVTRSNRVSRDRVAAHGSPGQIGPAMEKRALEYWINYLDLAKKPDIYGHKSSRLLVGKRLPGWDVSEWFNRWLAVDLLGDKASGGGILWLSQEFLCIGAPALLSLLISLNCRE